MLGSNILVDLRNRFVNVVNAFGVLATSKRNDANTSAETKNIAIGIQEQPPTTFYTVSSSTIIDTPEEEIIREADVRSNESHAASSYKNAVPTEITSRSSTFLLASDSGRCPQIFALLIGINIYNDVKTTFEDSIDGQRTRASIAGSTIPKFENLRGAVLDAQKFKSYLQDDLNVPEDHITFLQDGEATRDKIITAFKSLAQDKRIYQDDAIFIFYAGHGIRALPPSWRTGPEHPEMIELLVPSDFNRDPNNYQNMAIPDYTMAALLNKISQVKGNNITIVFDCCHSASALRGARIMFRSQNNPASVYRVPDDLDSDILFNTGVRGMRRVDSLKNYGNASYVYFSACASTESAAEDSNKGGRFSQALITILKNHDPNILTCSEIIKHLPPISGQHPECDGVHKNRPIFQSYVPSDSKKFFEVYNSPVEDRSCDFYMREGQAHGLALDDELIIFKSKSKEDQKEPVGTAFITAFDIDTNTTKLKAIPDVPNFNLPCQPAPALLRKSNETHLTLFVDPSDGSLNARVRHLLANALSDVVVTYNRGAAQIGLSVDKKTHQLRFDVHDSALTRRNVKLKPRFAPNDDSSLLHILQGLAHYYWHLKRTSEIPLSLEKISISFVGVRDTSLDEERFVALTDSCNLIDASGCINVTVNDSDSSDSSGPFYGFRLEYTKPENPKIYPILFYFDNIDFTITYAFNPAIGSNPEAPWSQSIMRIGYGSGIGATVSPFSFALNDGYDLEAGFFKLFLSNKPVELDTMLQEVSPFASLRGMQQKAPQLNQRFAHEWAVKTFPVILRRHSTSY